MAEKQRLYFPLGKCYLKSESVLGVFRLVSERRWWNTVTDIFPRAACMAQDGFASFGLNNISTP